MTISKLLPSVSRAFYSTGKSKSLGNIKLRQKRSYYKETVKLNEMDPFSKVDRVVVRKIEFKMNNMTFKYSSVKAWKGLYSTWNEMVTKPDPIGEEVWINPNKKELEAMVNRLHRHDHKKGIIGFHCTVEKEDMLQQALTNKGEIELRQNEHGEGLYIGDPQSAAHFAGQKDAYIFHIASTCAYGTNSDYGTNTTYLTGGGKVYVLAVYKINPAFMNYRRPWFWEVLAKWFKDCVTSK